MEKMIYANAIIELLASMQSVCHTHAELIAISKVWQQVKNMPTIEAEPVRHGKWNRYYRMHSGDTFVCNRCGSCFVVLQGADKMNICPNCGADMRESE